MKPTQTPTARESITFTLTSEEQDMLLRSLEDTKFYLNGHYALYNKLHFLFTNIGDACRYSAHIPEAPGQDGTTQIDVSSHPFYCVCDVCRTYLDFYDEADKGQGGNHA
ncbi:hypothetical protein B0F88_1059 [Methylobacter tundripaludum]|uniref:Uncharacterized protein n=1 Tax=Methylobacter tundripaludum TaxID=173365 RepID=A0A2S6H388_9GAMM|nr:hypothetical protein [Methylobacter tundripaludum]PPK71897.1 hypothetical protein B0F88_1059 [Methylobacter tundripaludum]